MSSNDMGLTPATHLRNCLFFIRSSVSSRTKSSILLPRYVCHVLRRCHRLRCRAPLLCTLASKCKALNLLCEVLRLRLV